MLQSSLCHCNGRANIAASTIHNFKKLSSLALKKQYRIFHRANFKLRVLRHNSNKNSVKKEKGSYLSINKINGFGLCVSAQATTTTAAAQTPLDSSSKKSFYRTASGLPIEVTVKDSLKYWNTKVSVGDLEENKNVFLHWGMYRSSSNKWFHPEDVVPKNSELDKATGGMRTKMDFNKSTCNYEIELSILKKYVPLTLGFAIYLKDENIYENPKNMIHIAVPIGMQPGNPLPYGTILISSSITASHHTIYTVNFSVVSRNASLISLCLIRSADDHHAEGSFLELVLDPVINRTGDVWHICVEGLKDLKSLYYAWRAQGGSRFSPGTLLLDPYAMQVLPIVLPDAASKIAKKHSIAQSGATVYLGCLEYLIEPEFNWDIQKLPRHRYEDLVAIEIDMSALNDNHGAFANTKSYINEIKNACINCVILENVPLSEDSLGPRGKSPVSFFAPDSRMANPNLHPNFDFKDLVKSFHENDIEVLLEVQYCFTGENENISSLKGLDSSLFFRGKGVLNCGHPTVQQLIIDSLRYWIKEYKIDGFVFLNAETMTQDKDGTVQDCPSLPERLSYDPLLKDVRLVAISGNDELLPRSGERGFPHWGIWTEWNKRFQSDMWKFLVLNTPGLLSNIATRLTGSPDLFAARWDGGLPGGLATGRGPAFGFNSISPLFKPFMESLEANASFAPGPSKKKDFVTLICTLLFASVIAQGVPVFPSQCLKSPILLQLIKQATSIRYKYSDILQPPAFNSPRNITWRGTKPNTEPDWDCSLGENFIAYTLQSSETCGIYIALNPSGQEVTIQLPALPESYYWLISVQTRDIGTSALSTTALRPGSSFVMSSGSAVLFEIEKETEDQFDTESLGALDSLGII